MTTHSVIEDFDVFLDRGLRLDAGAEPAMVNQFLFQRSPEAFHGSIIKTVSPAGHRGSHLELHDHSLVGECTVLTAPIGVVDTAGLRSAITNRPL